MGLIILQSFIGSGWLLMGVVLRVSERPGLYAAVGLSATVAIGGLLNLIAVISPAALRSLIVFGLIAFFAYGVVNRRTAQKSAYTWIQGASVAAKALLVLGIVRMTWRYLHSVGWSSFNEHDDYQGYFVFPTKMLQLGSLGEDPYSERRPLIFDRHGLVIIDLMSFQVPPTNKMRTS
jgi:hypothetical protein